jgi:hypothetical protein
MKTRQAKRVARSLSNGNLKSPHEIRAAALRLGVPLIYRGEDEDVIFHPAGLVGKFYKYYCGWRYKDLPKDCKEWCCWNCWETNQRDENSAKNLRDEGLRIRTLGTRGIAACPDVRPAMSGLLVGAEAAPL